MNATITWKVTNMDSYPKYDNYTDVVFNVHWDCLGNEEYSGSTYNSRVYGVNGVQFHSGSQFIPYNELTQNDVLTWLFESMGSGSKASYEQAVQQIIDNQINPPVVQLPLPWVTTGSLG